jgi:acyl carrier protein
MSEDLELRIELKDLLVKRLRLRGVAPASIVDDDPLVKGPLGLDSIDILELALAVEEAYGFKIADEKLGKEAFGSIAALASFVKASRRAAGDQGPGTA